MKRAPHSSASPEDC